MIPGSRRGFLKASIGASLVADFDFLLPVAQAAGADVDLDPDLIRFGPDIDPLVRLIQRTPRDECIGVFVHQLRTGLSYRRFLAALFLAAAETGDMHQLAQVYSAHRTSLESRMQERLVPLFWALDRIKRSHESDDAAQYYLRQLMGTLPHPNSAEGALRSAIAATDPVGAELAAVQLSRTQGARHAMNCLWEYARRNLAGTLGHFPIGVAKAWRTLNAVGWNHAEAPLRYLATEVSRFPGDRTYAPNLARVKKWLPQLPNDWPSGHGSNEATMQIYDLLRSAETDAACDVICETLAGGQAKAGAMWDAITLAASDTIFRYSVGGNVIGGNLVHAVTSTNSLRFGFETIRKPEARLLHLLQAAAVTGDYFVRQAKDERRLRRMNLIDDLDRTEPTPAISFRDVFDMLPPKSDAREQKDPAEREASDAASRLAFTLLRGSSSRREFVQTARGFLLSKASEDPHDVKYPAALFEDATLVSPKWRPYVLASSVHALHGSQSQDSRVLTLTKAALA